MTGTTFSASFSVTNSTHIGYASGNCDPVAQVCNGEFINGNEMGIILFALVSRDLIHIDYYNGNYSDFHLPRPSLRQSLDLVRTSEVFPPQCDANQFLKFVGTFMDPIYGGNFSICYNSSSGLLTGFYSEIGIIRGYYNTLYGVWYGQWFEAGTSVDSFGVETYGPVVFSPTSFSFFEGKYGFGSDVATPYGEMFTFFSHFLF